MRALVHKVDARSEQLKKDSAEIVQGNLLNLNEVHAATKGAESAYFCYPLRPQILQATAYFAQAARENNLSAIVNMSQISARRDALSHAAQDHWIA